MTAGEYATSNLSRNFFRVRKGEGKVSVSNVLDWAYILQISSEGTILRTLSKRRNEVLNTLIPLVSCLILIFPSLFLWEMIESSVFAQFGQNQLIIVITIALMFAGWLGTLIFGTIVLVYLFDLLFFPIYVRLSIPTAIVTVQDVQIGKGRLRHLVRLHLEKLLVPRSDLDSELLVIIVTTRRRLTKALSQLKS